MTEAYAVDIAIASPDPRASLTEIEKLTAKFGEVLGYLLNKAKCQIMVNKWVSLEDKRKVEQVTYLGVRLTTNLDPIVDNNLAPVLQVFLTDIDKFLSRITRQISFAASLATLSDKRLFPSFLRTVTSVSFQPGAVVEVLLHFGWTWVGVLASNNEFGIQGIQNLKKEAEKKDICIEFLETLPTQSSLSHIVTVIRRSSAKVIVCYAFAAHIIPILREVTVQGISDKVWLGIGSWFSTTVMSKRDLWETMNGTLGLSGYSGQIPGLKKFLYSIHPSKITGDIFLKSFWEYAFTCTLLGGLNTTDGRGMCTGKENVTLLDSSLYEVHSFRHPYYAYNAVYLLAQALHDLLSCKPQEGPFINNSCADPQNFHPWQMLHYVKNSCIRNSAGEEVFFDANGDSPPLMDLLYWHMTSRDTSQFVKVGTYNANRPPGYKLTINNSAIYWGGKYPQVPLSVCSKSCAPGYRKSLIEGRPRCCFSCVPCPDGSINNQTDSIYCVKCPEDQLSNNEKDSCLPKEIEFLSYGEPLGFIFSLLSLFLFFNATGTFCIFIRYRHTPVVRANNLQLSYILLVALMLCFLCSLVFIGQPRKVTCMFRQVIFGISFSLAISCVLAKTITVVIAFRATQPNSNLRRWIGSRTSSSIVLLCSFIEIAIGVIWLLTSPPFPELNNNATYWKIGAECNEGSISMFYCMLAYLGLLACISFGVAFLSRNLPDSFNEAKFITFSMIVFVSVWLSFIPAYLSTKGKYLVAVEIFAILSSGAGLLYCIYAPKVYIIFLRPEMNTREFFARKSTMTSRTA
ncbi:extracellular calcium-sensing receptor-like [Pleurodeles waltl]|uniref:extracellular calcium-sensing receptor-like n=1 Tax=Pleurodeles waltl TaxID=8319 RepID=UPI0037094D0F